MFCKNCGNQISEDSSFCAQCGAKKKGEQSGQSGQSMVSEQESFQTVIKDPLKSKLPKGIIRALASNIVGNESFATPTSGQMIFTQSSGASDGFSESISPVKFLIRGALGLITNIKGIIKDKKRLIFLAVMSLIWLLLMILPMLGINTAQIRILSFLTFAQGGTTGGVAGILGGSIGKGIAAFFYSSLIMPLFNKGKPFGGITDGFKTLFGLFGFKSVKETPSMLLGVGLSLIAYNFMNTNLTLQNSMIGLMAAFLSVKALSNKAGFLQGFIRSIMSKFSKNKTLDFSSVNRIIAGITTGFAVCIPLTVINIPYITSFIGLALIISSVIIFTVFKSRVEAV